MQRIRNKKLLYPELSYKLCGILFHVHNELGRFCRERQYQEKIESKLKEVKISYQREARLEILPDTKAGSNQADFLIDKKSC